MKVKFSICIPNYNYEKYIGETIQSVLSQTYQEFEIVIVDNASTDNSWEVIQSYKNKDSRINAYRNEYNVGFAPNLDKAAQKASNSFIIMLSADDTMKPAALEEYAQILSHSEVDHDNILLTSAVDIIDSMSVITGTYKKDRFHKIRDRKKYAKVFNDETVSDYDGIAVFGYIFPKFSVPGPFNATMYSKALYEKVGGYSSINLIGPDAHFAYKCLLSGVELIFINKPLFNYRIHQSGQLNISSKSKNINVLIDRYIFSNAYSDTQLERANIKRKEYVKAIVEKDCAKGGLLVLKNGEWLYAFRHLMFSLAAYPREAIRNKKLYVLTILLIMGPIGIGIARLALKNLDRN